MSANKIKVGPSADPPQRIAYLCIKSARTMKWGGHHQWGWGKKYELCDNSQHEPLISVAETIHWLRSKGLIAVSNELAIIHPFRLDAQDVAKAVISIRRKRGRNVN